MVPCALTSGYSSNEKANDLAEARRHQNPVNFEQPFLIPRTPEDVINQLGDAQDWPHLARRIDFDSLSTSAHFNSSDTVSMSCAEDLTPDALSSPAGIDAFQLDSLGLSEMHSPLYYSPMFRLDSDPEPDSPTPSAPPLSALGLEAMPTPQCIASPTSSVDSSVPCLDFLQTS